MISMTMGMIIMVDIAGRELMNFRPSGVATTLFNALMREGSGSVKGLFGSRRRITRTDAADMENVSKKRCSVDLVFFAGHPEVMRLPAMGSS